MRQTELAIAELKRHLPGLEAEVVGISTRGDRLVEGANVAWEGKGLFTAELERALLAGQVDCCVHSLKDLPVDSPPELCLAAVLRRGDPRDLLITREGGGLESLPAGARVGTSSLRRAAQLLAYRPDLVVVPVRGNVETRLARLGREDLDAVVLAAAGLERLGIWAGGPALREGYDGAVHVLGPDEMLPAPGQGALAVQVRAGAVQLAAELRQASDEPTEAAVRAERALLKGLGGGCRLPIAALGRVWGRKLELRGLVGAADGRTVLRGRRSGTPAEAEAIGLTLARELLAAGAGALLAQAPAQ